MKNLGFWKLDMTKDLGIVVFGSQMYILFYVVWEFLGAPASANLCPQVGPPKDALIPEARSDEGFMDCVLPGLRAPGGFGFRQPVGFG